MKKWCLVAVFFVFVGFLAFGDTEEQEEIDFLLFLPNSGSLFVNEERAMVQLDNLAKYFMGRELIPAQIYVYGYAAFAENDIEPVNLSMDRALWVINELEKRGVPPNLFAAPIGHGSVDLWGDNTEEEDRSPNRRVRVMLEGKIVTPETMRAADAEIKIASKDDEVSIRQESTTGESGSKFPWWIFLLLAILAILAGLIFFLLKKRKNADGKTTEPEKVDEPIIVLVTASESVKPIATSTVIVNLEEEILFRAYELYLWRNGQNENAYEDWCRAVIEIGARYEANGYQVYRENGNWWARKTVSRDV